MEFLEWFIEIFYAECVSENKQAVISILSEIQFTEQKCHFWEIWLIYFSTLSTSCSHA